MRRPWLLLHVGHTLLTPDFEREFQSWKEEWQKFFTLAQSCVVVAFAFTFSY